MQDAQSEYQDVLKFWGWLKVHSGIDRAEDAVDAFQAAYTDALSLLDGRGKDELLFKLLTAGYEYLEGKRKAHEGAL